MRSEPSTADRVRPWTRVRRQRSGLPVAAAMLALVGAAATRVEAEVNSPARLAALALLPDWSGIWEVEDSTATFEPQAVADGESRDHPPYSAEWEQKYSQVRGQMASLSDSNERYCAAGVPRLMGSAYRFIAMVTPEETLLHFSSREIRHIWTDGRAHPSADELRPTPWGDSIGHWEAQTLVIDTISIMGDLWLDPTGATLSDQAHIIERMSMVDRNHLRDELTIEDPVAFTRPWRLLRTYRRAPTKELAEQRCEWRATESAKK